MNVPKQNKQTVLNNQYVQNIDINIVKMRENNGTLFTKHIKHDIN